MNYKRIKNVIKASAESMYSSYNKSKERKLYTQKKKKKNASTKLTH